MHRLLIIMSLLAISMPLIPACSGRPVQTRSDEPLNEKAVPYQDVLGKLVTDKVVSDFITGNHCSSADQFQLCKEIGMALWVNASQVVETVYLYLNNVQDFSAYKGELPYGLKFYDIMEAVEYKLAKQGVGNGGFPDEGATPDHLHYWATYHQAGMTIIYNSPFPEDEDASIYAIVVNSQ